MVELLRRDPFSILRPSFKFWGGSTFHFGGDPFPVSRGTPQILRRPLLILRGTPYNFEQDLLTILKRTLFQFLGGPLSILRGTSFKLNEEPSFHFERDSFPILKGDPGPNFNSKKDHFQFWVELPSNFEGDPLQFWE